MKATDHEERRLSRRDFLSRTAFGVAAFATAGCESPTRRSRSAGNPYEGLDSDRFLGAFEIATGVPDPDAFTEGPAWRDGTLYFTNIPASQIWRFDPATGSSKVVRSDTHHANGLLFDEEGRLLCCEGTPGRITRYDLATGKLQVLADSYEGEPLAPANDLTYDREGRLWFSARPTPDLSANGAQTAVYRLDPDGTLRRPLLYPRVHMPNGLAVSPDGRTLYLIEAHPDADHHRDLRAFDLQADGSLENERVLWDFYPGRSGDGMAIDRHGNLWVAAGLHATRGTSETLDTRPGIHVFSPDGRLLAFRETPKDTVTNCAFGGDDGKTLWVTCGDLILRADVRI